MFKQEDMDKLIEKYGDIKAKELTTKVDKAIEISSIYSTAILYPGSYFPKTIEIGSGSFVIMSNKKGILTVLHVANIFIEKKADRVTIPFSETSSKSLAFEYIIKLPLHPGSLYPDLAFIALKDSDSIEWDSIMSSLKKQFFDLDEAKVRYDAEKQIYKNQGVLWLVHGNVAEGRKMINNRRTAYYKKSCPYIVVPNLKHIKKERYEYSQLGPIVVDLIECVFSGENREELARSFEGMSGAALWNVILGQDNNVESVSLVGIATIQDIRSDKLIFQGPISLYETFYPHVANEIQHQNALKAL